METSTRYATTAVTRPRVWSESDRATMRRSVALGLRPLRHLCTDCREAVKGCGSIRCVDCEHDYVERIAVLWADYQAKREQRTVPEPIGPETQS